MADTATSNIMRLAELTDGVEGTCFALLATRENKNNKNGEPFYRCSFVDRDVKRDVMVWLNTPWFEHAKTWVEGEAYRITGRGKASKFGLQVEIVEIRPATSELDASDGYRFEDLVVGSKFDANRLFGALQDFAGKIVDRNLQALVRKVLEDHGEAFRRMPAAQSMHHAFIGGLVEHVWSVTRIASRLADHYASYYDDLNPPLNKDVVVAGAILHDIGKLLELQAHIVEARYTTVGQLIGHITMGRDLVREAAAVVGGVDPETLMLLEHSILSHHGRKEFGSPVEPQTVEALILSYADELDAKMNAVVNARRVAVSTRDVFTDRVRSFEGRRFYNGVTRPLPTDDESSAEPTEPSTDR